MAVIYRVYFQSFSHKKNCLVDDVRLFADQGIENATLHVMQLRSFIG